MPRTALLFEAAFLVLGVLAAPPALAAGHRGPATVSGSVFYERRGCFAAPSRDYEPIPGARLVVDAPGGRSVSTTLSEEGKFKLEVPGAAGHAGPLGAEVVFAGDGLKVKPDPAVARVGDSPYSVHLALHGGANGKVILVHEGEAGVANVWSYLREAVIYAKRRSPTAIRPVTALLKYGKDFSAKNKDVGISHYEPGKDVIRIQDDPDSADDHDDWEPFTIVHEYGHHLLLTLAKLSTRSGGNHSAGGVYPNRPGLAYSEGFAHAFAAAVLGKTDLGYECGSFVHLGEDTGPQPQTRRYAQYNETAAAWVLLRVVRRFGLKAFLSAMIDFKPTAGHYPGTMREVRDALALGAEKTPADDHFDNETFFDGRMAWGFAAKATDAPGDDKTAVFAAKTAVEVWVEGPYGSCRAPQGDPETPLADGATWEGGVAPGALDFTYQDDCLASWYNGFAELEFPILPGQRQESDTLKVMARWYCEPGEDPGPDHYDDPGDLPYDASYWACPATRIVHLRFSMGDGVTGGGSGGPATPDPAQVFPGLWFHEADVQISATGTPIALIAADGGCGVIGGLDCGV